MGTSIVEDPRRRLETIVAFLRQGCLEGGVRLDVKGGHALTPHLEELVGRGDMAVLHGPGRGGRRTRSILTTPRGQDRLADYDVRFGETFGHPDTLPRLRADQPRRRRR